MKIQVIKKFSEIERLATEWAEQGRGPYWFRGQSDKNWDLVPSVFRHLAKIYEKAQNSKVSPDDITNTENTEIRIYEEFRERARAYKHDKVDMRNPWEMLCLAQHFGAPTRFLDWTSNFLVAAYFAVEDLDDTKDGMIWCLNTPKFLGNAENKRIITHIFSMNYLILE